MTTSGQSETGYRESLGWNLGLSAYWFATSWKWFILLLAVLPGQVRSMVPDGEKNQAWGLVFMIGATWAVIGPAIFGNLSDRINTRWGRRRPFIAIGSALTVIALMFLAGANSLWVLIIGYLLLQISDDVAIGPYSALIPEVVPEDRRGRASSIMGGFTVLAQIGAAITGLVLGDVVLIYVGIATVNVICAVVVIFTIRHVPSPPREPKPSEPFIESWLRPWRNADFRWVWFTRFLNALGFYLVQPYLSNYLKDVILPFSTTGAAVESVASQAFEAVTYSSVFFTFPGPLTLVDAAREEAASSAVIKIALTISLMAAIASIWTAKVSDTWGRKRVIYTAGVLMAGSVLPFAFVSTMLHLWVIAGVFGLGYGMYLAADWALVSDVLPNKEEFGKDMGIWQSSNSIVQIFAGAAGRAIDGLNRAAYGSGYFWAFVTASGLFLMSTVLVRQVKGSR